MTETSTTTIESGEYLFYPRNDTEAKLLNEPSLAGDKHFSPGWWTSDARYRDMPAELLDGWTRRFEAAGGRHLGNASNSFDEAAAQLLIYLDVVAQQARTAPGRNHQMPSKSVDLVWHAWIEDHPQNYNAFCSKHFGAVPRHSENAAGMSQTEQEVGLMRTWVGMQRAIGQQVNLTFPPVLFTIDKSFRIPGGRVFESQDGQVCHLAIKPDGKPDRTQPHWHDSICVQTALSCGLVSQDEGVKMTGGKFSQWLGGARKNQSRLPRPALNGRKKSNDSSGCGGYADGGDGGGCGGD